MTTRLRIAALALILAALTVVPAGSDLRAHSPGGATLTALTVTAGGTAQTLSPTFSRTVYSYTVQVANSVAQVTVAGTPDGDGTVTPDQQVNLPEAGATRVNVVVRHTGGGTTTTQSYTVRVIRDGTVATDRAVLMELYNSTDGDNWTYNTNWGSDEPLNRWFNVTLDSNNRVQYLVLGRNQLRGSIPDLSGLTHLTYLHLRDNALSGSIPASLGDLTRLEWLTLDRNQLDGAIPDSLGDLASLTHGYLYENQLSGTIPASLGKLTNLTHLYLGENQLSGTIPASLGNLAKLQELILPDNQLSGRLPTSLGDLANLTALDISGNNLDGPIPAELGDLSSLTLLSLWGNQLSGSIPDSLGSLASLGRLYLSGNALSGTIPDSLGDLASLWSLSLWGNQLSGEIPDSLGRLTSLYYLYLSSNQLDGTIPDSLGDLANLWHLSLWGNQLRGEIPDRLGNLTNLRQLSLSRNQLTGGIPASLGDLTQMTSLYLNSNQLSGPVPDLSRLTSLQQLYLWGNQLDGPIPDWLGDLTDLQELSLSSNQLTGEIPAALGNLTELQTTRFAYNLLTGCVPLGLRYLVAADDFAQGVPAHDFIAVDANRDGDTYDDGDIPGLHLPFCMLGALALSDGTLVPAFAGGTAAYTADVANSVDSTTVTATLPNSSDRLSIRKGTASYRSGAAVPLAVGPNEITVTVTPTDGTPTLTYSVNVFRAGVDRETLIALYNSTGGASWTDKTNWLSATEPLDEWFGVEADSTGNVTKLELSGNNLRGTLPVALGSLINLTTLDLSDNRVSGTIPDLSPLTSLQDLDLRRQPVERGRSQIGWATPASPRNRLPLRDLSLRDNRLYGADPGDSLGNLYLLEVLYLDRNQLSGPITAEFGNLLRLRAARFERAMQLSGMRARRVAQTTRERAAVREPPGPRLHRRWTRTTTATLRTWATPPA